MPLMESQPDALAQVYAKSLFELAEAKGGQDTLEQTQGELEDILEIARENAHFNEFLASRTLGAAARAESIRKIFEGRCSDLTLRFMLLLNRKGRLSHLPAIVAAFDKLVQTSFGRVEVDVYMASPIGTDVLESIKQRFQTEMGKEAIVHPYSDETMIGGIKIRVGDKLIDGSISSQLRRMKDQFSGMGAARLREKVAGIIEESTGH
jgi:F-type H+-transporting ATPase subunit delta